MYVEGIVMWTINRGLRTAAGTFILISLLLAIVYSKYWLLLTAFVGINLFQSGFTNWCGMMKILKRFGLKEGELENVDCHNEGEGLWKRINRIS